MPAPTVQAYILNNALAAGQTTLVAFIFSEAPIGFDVSDVVSPGGTITNLVADIGNPKRYQGDFAPHTEGSFSVTVPSGSYANANSELGGGGGVGYVYDATAPSLVITASDEALATGQTATLTFTFSEAPSGFVSGDITPVNGNISAFAATGDAKVYTAVFTPTADGPASVSVAASAYADSVGNLGGATSKALTVDTVAPTLAVTVGDATLVTGETTTVTFTFSETPAGFVSGDIHAVGGVVSALAATGDPKVFTGIFSATGTGPASVSVDNSAYDDLAGNHGTSGTVGLTVSAPPPPEPPAPPAPTTGNDVLTVPDTGGSVAAGDGDDEVTGGAGGDVVQGNLGADSVSGGGGADIVRGGQGADLVQGNSGEDNVFGDAGDDLVHGGQGNDHAQGNAGNDFVAGDLGDDSLNGGQGDDLIYGGGGADFLSGDLGDDILRGGDGADLFSFAGASLGHDTIGDFSLAGGDMIHIASVLVRDFAGLAGHLTANAAGDAVITLGGTVITVTGVAPGALTVGDFIFG